MIDSGSRDPNTIRRRRFLGLGLVLGVIGFVVCFRGPLFLGNFGVVDPGRAYRAAQPKGSLPRLIEENRLATVLNLRGGSPRDSWYADEVRACAEAGIDFYDLPMSATERPGRRDLLHLIDLFQSCRFPLLIHCKSGADRTGLASALYLMIARNEPPEKALRAFTIQYGHVPLLGTQRLHEPFHEYRAWLAANHLEHAPDRFRDWVANNYRSPEAAEPLAELKPGPREPLFGRLLFPDGEPARR